MSLREYELPTDHGLSCGGQSRAGGQVFERPVNDENNCPFPQVSNTKSYVDMRISSSAWATCSGVSALGDMVY